VTSTKKTRNDSGGANHSETPRANDTVRRTATPAEPLSGPDRRRHVRYRLAAPVTILKADGTSIPTMSVEISQSGMSIATAASLQTGDTVDVEPVGGAKASAVVRYRHGNFYGLEFSGLTKAQIEQIQDDCRILPRFHTHSLSI
jgi:hypothetical protein